MGMYTMKMFTRPRFLAILALLAALCSLASACKGKPQCCLRRRMSYGTSRRKLALFSRANRSQRRRLPDRCDDCKNDPNPCFDCRKSSDAFDHPVEIQFGRRHGETDDTNDGNMSNIMLG